MELTISQHFYWKNLCRTVYNTCSNGKLPPKDAKAASWDTLCIDLIDKYQFMPKGSGKKYKMTTKSGKKVYLQAVTMIDPAT